MSRLAYFSMPTKYDTDVGIDFYCELLEQDSPSISFFVQAKGTEHFDDQWGHAIQKSTIRYWLTRFSPVFLVVFDEPNQTCYWMSIEDIRYSLLKELDSEHQTVYVRVDRTNVFGKDENTEFRKKIKDDFISLQMSLGQANFRGEGYIKRVPDPPRSPIEVSRIRENVRMNLYSLFRHYSNCDDLQNMYICCDFLTKLDKSHYNHFYWLGLVNRRLGNEEAAQVAFSEALSICERDKNWPAESMKELKEMIRKEMKGAGTN